MNNKKLHLWYFYAFASVQMAFVNSLRMRSSKHQLLHDGGNNIFSFLVLLFYQNQFQMRKEIKIVVFFICSCKPREYGGYSRVDILCSTRYCLINMQHGYLFVHYCQKDLIMVSIFLIGFSDCIP